MLQYAMGWDGEGNGKQAQNGKDFTMLIQIKKIYEPSIRTFKKEAAQDKSVFEACQFFGIII